MNNTLKNIIKHNRYAVPFFTVLTVTALAVVYAVTSLALYLMDMGNINLAELIISALFLCAYFIGAFMIIHQQNS